MEWVSNLKPIPNVPSRGCLITSTFACLGTIKYVLEISLDRPSIVLPKNCGYKPRSEIPVSSRNAWLVDLDRI